MVQKLLNITTTQQHAERSESDTCPTQKPNKELSLIGIRYLKSKPNWFLFIEERTPKAQPIHPLQVLQSFYGTSGKHEEHRLH